MQRKEDQKVIGGAGASQSSSMQELIDQGWMLKALLLADKAAELGEVPVGAIVVLDGEIIGQGWNQPIGLHDPTAHAEMVALREAASKVGNYRVVNADLYVTLEPCSMCAGAMVHARVRRVIFGAYEPKAGVIVSQQRFLEQDWLNHCVEHTAGVLADVCSEKLSQFFKNRRAQKRREKDQLKDQ
jgi:tRNA(adenine34) deaminase